MKPHTTLRRLSVWPKDKVDPRDGVYIIHCKSCDGKYVGETKRLLKTRVREHSYEVETIGDDMPFTHLQKLSIILRGVFLQWL